MLNTVVQPENSRLIFEFFPNVYLFNNALIYSNYICIHLLDNLAQRLDQIGWIFFSEPMETAVNMK